MKLSIYLIVIALAAFGTATPLRADIDAVAAQTPVFRLQVVTYTGRGDDDGTDDDLFVTLRRGPENQEPVDRYFLDGYGDNFRLGKTESFDIPPTKWNIKRLGDIRQFVVGITGTDAWCYQDIKLLVNNAIWILPKNVQGKRCLDNPSGNLTATAISAHHSYSPRIKHSALSGDTTFRQLHNWQDILSGREPLTVSVEQIKELVESAIAQRIQKYESLRFLKHSDIKIEKIEDDMVRVSFSILYKKYMGVTLFPGVDRYWWLENLHIGDYRVNQRNDHLQQSFLQLIRPFGPNPDKRRLFHDQGELFRIKLFTHNHRQAEILRDGSLRFDFR